MLAIFQKPSTAPLGQYQSGTMNINILAFIELERKNSIYSEGEKISNKEMISR
jgi:hypothetical protein